ncbi:MAG: hypothetical protein OQJ81_10715 [Melioribacteraceae bacterium]|nr:hypothetical protein [Melioribacteraceae bacterium]
MDILINILLIFCFIAMLYLVLEQRKYSKKISILMEGNKSFLESIEKYVEIFNEENVNKLLENKSLTDETLAHAKIELIKKEYRTKLLKVNNSLSEEHEMLIDFVTLSLSLLIKTPPNLRARLILENTDNEFIKKILLSKLEAIKKHYIPVSLIEIAISKEPS